MRPSILDRLHLIRPHRVPAWVMGVSLSFALGTVVSATEDAPLGTAVGAFAKEQALAESYAGLMETLGRERFSDYVKGIRLYATARAEFTRLIEQLKQQLIQNEAPASSADFEAALAAAVTHRIAFTAHVDAMVEAIEAEGQQVRAGVADYITGASELLQILVDAGKTIWTEYRSIQEKKRKETMDQLDTLKWKPFAEIASG